MGLPGRNLAGLSWPLAICPLALVEGLEMNAGQRKRHFLAWLIVLPVALVLLIVATMIRDEGVASERPGWVAKERGP